MQAARCRSRDIGAFRDVMGILGMPGALVGAPGIRSETYSGLPAVQCSVAAHSTTTFVNSSGSNWCIMWSAVGWSW